ncbi:hypothetical protein [Cardinium endosymbiont of Nabis limbatus]|uniref:hypothetical protein n=1 Tax=Cardinium endosymbiont of Nabis limbatus TaxID=3066217 RepID=UPI003AF37F19
MVIKNFFLYALPMLAGCNRLIQNAVNYEGRLKADSPDAVGATCMATDGRYIAPVIAIVAAMADHFMHVFRAEDLARYHAADSMREADRYLRTIVSHPTLIAQNISNDMFDRACVKATAACNEAKVAADHADVARALVKPAVEVGATLVPAVMLVIDAAVARGKAAADHAEATIKGANAAAARTNATAARANAKGVIHATVALADHIAAYTEADAKLANDIALRAQSAAKVANNVAFSVLFDGLSNVSAAQLPVDLQFAQAALVHHLTKCLPAAPFHLNKLKNTFSCHD